MPKRIQIRAVDKDPAMEILSRNLAMLIEQYQAANPSKRKQDIAKAMDWSLRSLATARQKTNAIRLDRLDALAAFFKLEPWQLLLPDLTAEFLLNPKIARGIRAFIHSDPEDREAIERLLSRSAPSIRSV